MKYTATIKIVINCDSDKALTLALNKVKRLNGQFGNSADLFNLVDNDGKQIYPELYEPRKKK